MTSSLFYKIIFSLFFINQEAMLMHSLLIMSLYYKKLCYPFMLSEQFYRIISLQLEIPMIDLAKSV